MKAYELLSSEDKWTKGYMARDSKGRRVTPNSPEATCWCVLGAISKCYEESSTLDIVDKLSEIIEYREIGVWNDFSTYKKVIDLLKSLDI